MNSSFAITLCTYLSQLCKSLRTINHSVLISILDSLSFSDYQVAADLLFDVFYADCTISFDNFETSKPFLNLILTLSEQEIATSSVSFLRTNTIGSKLLSRVFLHPSVHNFLKPPLTTVLSELHLCKDPDYIVFAERVINLLQFHSSSLSCSILFLISGIVNLLDKYNVHEVRKKAILGSFFFLRFVNPGVLFDNWPVANENSENGVFKAKRLQLSKTLQTVANLEKTLQIDPNCSDEVREVQVKIMNLQDFIKFFLNDLIMQARLIPEKVPDLVIPFVSVSNVVKCFEFFIQNIDKLPKSLSKLVPNQKLINRLSKVDSNCQCRLLLS
ncbi:hypothetical protein RCL1_000372 [Eukaryota sp. TZLM3-RCL]